MNYQPNRLILESGHRLVVEHFSRIAGKRLVLRPARKCLFETEPNLPSLQVELNKPAFAALIDLEDSDARPYVVFETDPVSAGIRDLYRNADLPFVEADQTGGRGMLRFERPGFSAKLQFDDRGDLQAVESILRWAETAGEELRGKLVRNELEKQVARALSAFSDEVGVSVHFQVPFGYAAGYRQDLPRSIARHTIEMALSIRPDISPDAPVVLPIRIETKHEISREAESVERDQSVADFVCSVGMPMAAIQPGDDDKFRVTYSLDGGEDIQLAPNDDEGWLQVMRDITQHALGEISAVRREDTATSAS